MEEQVTIQCSNIRLAGMLEENSPDRGVVVTHPHPLYGGNMDNPVVIQTVQCFSQKGFTTLRFNFRGTGNSTGMFDNGEGEQEDVRACVDFLKNRGCKSVWLAGYSFGSRINAAVVSSGLEVEDHIMVSPPMGFMSFDDIEALTSTGLILTGENDEIAPPDLIRAKISQWSLETRFEILEGCDHFYSGYLENLANRLTAYLNEKYPG
ncbi:alpha/beta hydrolase [Desulfospira joergensenii]|uniref:alpha/beta hydrolase n=1 Tax=Desulfospira joergensenii TaxID=53329 RepID=UPI0003B461E1|nr:alpha/beta family hydrolase [Desulfospira joergensenii]